MASSWWLNRQSSTAVALSEKMAKFTPWPSHVAPRGYGWPGHTRIAFVDLGLKGSAPVPRARRWNVRAAYSEVVEAATSILGRRVRAWLKASLSRGHASRARIAAFT